MEEVVEEGVGDVVGWGGEEDLRFGYGDKFGDIDGKSVRMVMVCEWIFDGVRLLIKLCVLFNGWFEVVGWGGLIWIFVKILLDYVEVKVVNVDIFIKVVY